jgi:hypothetical protein
VVIIALIMTHTATHIKRLPAPTVKRMLRGAGHTYSSVASRRDVHPSLVSRVVRKQATSEAIWEDIVWALSHPRPHGDAA